MTESETPTPETTPETPETPSVRFTDLGLSQPVLKSLERVGYETPSPIQAATIPLVLDGTDLIGQAQTGTGKTAAFALPALSRIDVNRNETQVLVLAPTRELAIQVAEAFQKYAADLPGFRVAPIYGGQDYRPQIRQLQRGAHVVVGTPGRVMDHIRQRNLLLDGLDCLVLDEADEMLRMGFIDDVEWVLEQTPPSRQIALFSATMPSAVKRIAQKHLQEPEHIVIEAKTSTADTIRQRFWMVSRLHKLDALTRILEAEPFEGMIVFVRTKNATVELAERLEARGFAAAALNGDIPQQHRERTVQRLKDAKLDIVVATDVAARGLDVDRITHVVNYDIPYDTESYVHRIGRTGRAGRKGDAILFVAPRERRMLRAIEKATSQPIEQMDMPTPQTINDRRTERFLQGVTDTLASEDLTFFTELLEKYRQEHDTPALEIAAALAHISQGDRPLLLDLEEVPPAKPMRDDDRRDGRDHRDRDRQRDSRPRRGSERYRLEVGRKHGARAGHIVGAIANEAGLDGQDIGKIDIHDFHTFVDLPEGMPREIFRHLQKVWVAGQQINLSKLSDAKPFAGKRGGNHTGHKPPKMHHHSDGKPKPKPKSNDKHFQGETFKPKKKKGKFQDKPKGKGKPHPKAKFQEQGKGKPKKQHRKGQPR